MGREINLLKKYPRTIRDTSERAIYKTEEDKIIARKFDYDFFDGDRKYGYGGYHYNSKYWSKVVEDIIKFYNLSNESSLLDVGSGKGFMLHDFKVKLPEIELQGLDISEYAVKNSLDTIKEFQIIGNAKNLPFKDKEFDLALSIVTLHNLNREDCATALLEAQRVSKNCYVTLDAYSNEKEKKQMSDWNLTALTVMHVDDWIDFFIDIGFNGDYYWFKP